jgi:hypothetical protein
MYPIIILYKDSLLFIDIMKIKSSLLFLLITKVKGFIFRDYFKKIKLFNPYDDLHKQIIDKEIYERSVNIILQENKPKFCINCRFFLDNKNKQFGRCALYPKNDNMTQKYYLVTGKLGDNDIEEYYHCTTVRSYENMCGKNGTKYEELKNL